MGRTLQVSEVAKKMKHVNKLALVLATVLGGCASMPTGPSVNVLPAQGKPFEVFQSEDAKCREWAEQRMGQPSAEEVERRTATGAVVGTAAGAGIGALFGSASGHAGVGALVGAASGLLVGSAAGSSSGEVDAYVAQRRYDNAYMQCMYANGNQVPGYRIAKPAPPPPAAAPTPPPAVAPPPVAAAPPEEIAPPPAALPAVADDYPPPPEVYVESAPQFIYSPELNMYVAVGVPYDLVYSGGEYYYFSRGRWYRSAYYDGPWVYVPRRRYPRTFASYRIEAIRECRDREYHRYEVDRGHYGGRFYRPEYREGRRW